VVAVQPPVASIKQITAGIVMPAANVIFDSVSMIVDAKDVQENQPRTEEEWARLGAADARKPEGILEAGEAINQSCDNCHQKYQR
jgi:hypothetical protein